jgi:hypothetical protein
MIEIIEVKTKKQIKLFANFPSKMYKNNKLYVPSFYSDEINILNPKKNLLLNDCDIKCFLAYKDDKVVGRIAGIIQKTYNKLANETTVRFSRFECIDDNEVAKKLLEAVELFGKEQGMNICHGPWGFNDQDREGLLVYGFDKRSTYATNYNYEYYEKLIKENGYQDECEWFEYKFKIPKETDARFLRIAEHVKSKMELRELADEYKISQLIKLYGKKIFQTVNECYKHLEGYVPVEGKTMDNVIAQFSVIINPKFLSVIVDKNDNVVGFGTALADICSALQKSKGRLLPFGFIRLLKAIKKPTGLELALIAVTPEYQKKGVNALILSRIMTNIINEGIQNVESNPELSSNSAVQSQWNSIEKEVIKKRKCFTKPI